MAQFSMEIMRLTGSVPRGNQHLFERAVVTVRGILDQIGIPESKTEADPVIDCGWHRKACTRQGNGIALLDAADMIRILRVILDPKE